MTDTTVEDKRKLRILLLGARRRIVFARQLRAAAKSLDLELTLLGADTDDLDPLRHFCDSFFLLPHSADATYFPRLLTVVEENQIDLVIPWNDRDIARLNELVAKHPQWGRRFVIPPAAVTNLCLDKGRLAAWCKENDIRHPVLYGSEHPIFPCVVKPASGQGSVGVVMCKNQIDFAYARQINAGKAFLVQEMIEGTEYTIDVFCWPKSCVFTAVPRKRIKTRGGEVLIAQTELNEAILAFVGEIVRKLDFSGMLNCQIMLDRLGNATLIELNPRFGGGVDLSIESGANFPLYIIEFAIRGELSCTPPKVRDGLIMTRYHESVFAEAT